jgi:quinol monooxygenase YgiN
LKGCVGVVRQARAAGGCLDYAQWADLVEPDRINVYERWDSRASPSAFRGPGPSSQQRAAIQAVQVCEYEANG